MSTLGDAANVNPVIKFLPHTLHVCGRNFITGLKSATSPKVDITSTCKVRKKCGGSLRLLTCSPSSWQFRLQYRSGRKSGRDSWITLYYTQLLQSCATSRYNVSKIISPNGHHRTSRSTGLFCWNELKEGQGWNFFRDSGYFEQ